MFFLFKPKPRIPIVNKISDKFIVKKIKLMSVSLESTRIEPVIQKIIFLNIPEIPLRSKGLEPL
jgi:hypothetical protein